MKKIVSQALILLLTVFHFLAIPLASKAVGNRLAESEIPRQKLWTDLSFRWGKDQWGGGLSVWGSHGFGQNKRFSIALGIRHSTQFGKNIQFTTAPAQYAGKAEKEDTLVLPNSSISALNLAIGFQYQLFSKVSLGFNIDLAGISFGPTRKGTLTAASIPYETQSAPTSTNVLLVAANDIGTLNSEFYLQYQISDKWSAKGGFSHLFTELKTDKQYVPTVENDRFRNINTAFTLGFQYRIL